jgi:hypothetical protein
VLLELREGKELAEEDGVVSLHYNRKGEEYRPSYSLWIEPHAFQDAHVMLGVCGSLGICGQLREIRDRRNQPPVDIFGSRRPPPIDAGGGRDGGQACLPVASRFL